MPLEKYMPKVAGFLDLHSLDVLAIISFKNAFLLRENRLVVINRERLKSNNRGYRIQQNSFMKSFLKDEVHKYEIKDKPDIKISSEHAQYKWIDIDDLPKYKEKFAGEGFGIIEKYFINK